MKDIDTSSPNYVLTPPVPGMIDDKDATYKFLLEIWRRTSGFLEAQNEPAISAGGSMQYWAGDKSWKTLSTSAVAEDTDSPYLYYTDVRARASISTSALGLDYSSTDGILSLDPLYAIPTASDVAKWQANSSNSSVGTNSASLGSNCPAAFFTAPYAWVDFIAPDGTPCVMPIWMK